jgi:hypothetical protein
MSLSGQSGAPCSTNGQLPSGSVIVPLDQWRAMGKPHNVEEFELFLSRIAHSGKPERRQHPRLDLVLGVHLSRPSSDRVEDAATENLSRSGAMVRSTLDAGKGDIVLFEESSGTFRTRAQVRDVSGTGADRRLHLHFLDANAPDELLTSH